MIRAILIIVIGLLTGCGSSAPAQPKVVTPPPPPVPYVTGVVTGVEIITIAESSSYQLLVVTFDDGRVSKMTTNWNRAFIIQKNRINEFYVDGYGTVYHVTIKTDEPEKEAKTEVKAEFP